MTRGWMIGVLVETPGEPQPTRHFYAVSRADRARAEWAAADQALGVGAIAASPYAGMEPVEAVAALSARAIALLGLDEGEMKALGTRWPRRWLSGDLETDKE